MRTRAAKSLFFNTIPEDVWRTIACRCDREGLQALSATSREHHRIIQGVLCERLASFSSRHNMHLVTRYGDYFTTLESHSMVEVQSFAATVHPLPPGRRHVLLCNAEAQLRRQLGKRISAVVPSRRRRYVFSSPSRLIVAIEVPDSPTVTSYTCHECGCRIKRGAVTFAELAREHSHGKRIACVTLG